MVGQFRKQTQLVSHQAITNIPKPVGSTIGDDVANLLQFAGAATDVVTNHLNEKVQQDVIRQQNRVAMGMLPSQDATQGGYRAAKALGIEIGLQKYRAKLDEGAQMDLSDDEWVNYQLEAQKQLQTELNERYPELQGDQELETLMSMGVVDMVPSMTYKREAFKLEREAAKRGEDFQTFVTLNKGMTDEEFVNAWKETANGLMLSEDKAETLGIEAIINSKDGELLDKAARMRDSKGVLLTEKYGELATAVTRHKQEQAKLEAYQIAQAKDSLYERLVRGTLSDSQAQEEFNAMNARYGGAFASQDEMEHIYSKARAQRAENTRLASLQGAAASGQLVDIPKKDKPAVIEGMFQSNLQMIMSEYTDEELQSPEKQSAIYNQTVNLTATQLNQAGLKNDAWEKGFKTLAASNIEAIAFKGEGGKEYLTQDAMQQLNTYIALPDSMKSQYAKAETARILNRADRFIKSGIPHAQALRQAQEAERNPEYVRSGDIYDQAKNISEGLYNHWIASDMPESQRAFTDARIQERLRDGYSPEMIESDLKENSFQLENGQVIFANQSAVMRAFGVSTPDRIDQILTRFKEHNRDLIEQRLKYMGGTFDDAYWDIDVDTGMAVLRAGDGWALYGTSVPLSEMRQTVEALPDEETYTGPKLMPNTVGLYAY